LLRKALALVYSDFHMQLCVENSDLFSHMHLIVLSTRGNRSIALSPNMTSQFIGSEESFFKRGVLPSAYYDDVTKLIIEYHPDTVVLFTLNKPISRFVMDTFNSLSIELWEDGIGHYLPTKLSVRDIMKNQVKKVFGFYANDINTLDYGLDRVKVRDRFIRKNLKHVRIVAADGPRIFVGQPVVEDGFCKKKDYDFVVDCLESHGFIYLAHPREKSRRFKTDLRSLDVKTAEEYIEKNGCSVIASIFSTVNFNVKVNNNYLLTSAVGLHYISTSLDAIAQEAGVKIPAHLDQLIGDL
jgi:hypothetical protein